MENKVNIISSVKRNSSTKYFEADHITSQTFMRPRPIFMTEVFPNRKLKVSVESFARLDPLPVPTFGRARVANRAFFVPYRTIFKDFNSFIVSSPVSDGKNIVQVPSVPTIPRRLLWEVLKNSLLSTTTTGNSYDFKDENGVKYILTPTGVHARAVFNGLGYQINPNANDSTPVSALPLLAYVKVFYDWYYPSQYAMSSTFVTWITQWEKQKAWVSFEPSVSDVVAMMVGTLTSYDASLASSGWDNPVSPNSYNLNEAPISINDITSNDPNNDLVIQNSSNYTPQADVSTNSVFSQYMIDALRSLTDYTKRHQLSSVRAVDRYLSEYGINLANEITKRSIYLGADEFSLQFGDVMSHSETTNMPLGGYAGKGVAYGDHSFNCDMCDEFGLFLVINSVNPVVKTYQGDDPFIHHVNLLDFYKADFDSLAVSAIPQRLLFVPEDGTSPASSPSKLNDHISMFFPIYSEYFTDRGLITGLPSCNSQNALLESYSLLRKLDSFVSSSGEITHSINMASGSDKAQYNRIFNNTDDYDKMIFIHHVEVEATDPASPLFEVYHFDHDDDNKAVQLQVGGSRVN